MNNHPAGTIVSCQEAAEPRRSGRSKSRLLMMLLCLGVLVVQSCSSEGSKEEILYDAKGQAWHWDVSWGDDQININVLKEGVSAPDELMVTFEDADGNNISTTTAGTGHSSLQVTIPEGAAHVTITAHDPPDGPITHGTYMESDI